MLHSALYRQKLLFLLLQKTALPFSFLNNVMIAIIRTYNSNRGQQIANSIQ